MRVLLLSILFSSLLPLQLQAAVDYGNERKLYSKAMSALKAKDRKQFNKLLTRLEHYPLYPYLQYSDLLRRLSKLSDREVSDFLTRNKGTVLEQRMRGKWLRHLGEARAWKRYAHFYEGSSNTTLRCYALRSDYHQQRREGLLQKVETIWLNGKSQPKACDPLFALLEQSPRMTGELVWKRIELAMEHGSLTLANYLSKRLSKSDRKRYALWKQVRRDPARGLREQGLKRDDSLNRKIVTYGMQRLARRDAKQAWSEWQRLAPRYAFSDKQRAEVARYTIGRGVLQRLPESLQWIDQLQPEWVNDEVHRWQAKMAIHLGDWSLLERAIRALPKDQRQEKVWRYWLARALLEQGEQARGEKLLAELATTTSYYGFLAADRLKLSYALQSVPLVEDSSGIEKTAARPGMQRVRELLHFGRTTEARREWDWQLRRIDNRETRLVALLAKQWGWHDGAILTAARAGHLGDLELRFPMPYRELVVKSAKRQKIDTEWVYGILRRESAFMHDARSGAGAVGLMQLMPRTARELSKSLGIKRLRTSELYQPSRNIQLGSSYLRRMLDRFKGNQALATAAYNAGPYRVESWLPEKGRTPADRWVELIPYTETRNYVKAVMAYTTIFDDKLNRLTTPLKKRMLAIKR